MSYNKLAAIYDIHGNLPALEAVLETIDADGFDGIVMGGDVLLGPMPLECLSLLEQVDLPVSYVLGNCEVAVLDYALGKTIPEKLPDFVKEDIRWTAKQVEGTWVDAISKWQLETHHEVAEQGSISFFHSAPNDPDRIFTRNTDRDSLEKIFDGIESEVIVCGHTHMQFDIQLSSIRLVNAGSVGMPFADPGAYWLELGSDGVQLRRTDYDLTNAAERILSTDYPAKEMFAKQHVLSPPSEELMLSMYDKA